MSMQPRVRRSVVVIAAAGGTIALVALILSASFGKGNRPAVGELAAVAVNDRTEDPATPDPQDAENGRATPSTSSGNSSPNVPSSPAVSAATGSPSPSHPTAPARRYDRPLTGYLLQDASPDAFREAAGQVDVLLDWTWQESGDNVINEAKKAGIKVVPAFYVARGDSAPQQQMIDLVRRHRDTILGVCWIVPYTRGHTPEDLAELGSRMKAEAPGLEFWSWFVARPRGRQANLPVPKEVDRIIVSLYGCSAPGDVDKYEPRDLPAWLRIADGRPLLIGWSGWASERPGLVPNIEEGTIERCAAMVRKYGLGGVMIEGYGCRAFDGVETNPKLVAEIRKIASDPKALTPDPDFRQAQTLALAAAEQSQSKAPSAAPDWSRVLAEAAAEERQAATQRQRAEYYRQQAAYQNQRSEQYRQQAIIQAEQAAARAMNRFGTQISGQMGAYGVAPGVMGAPQGARIGSYDYNTYGGAQWGRQQGRNR